MKQIAEEKQIQLAYKLMKHVVDNNFEYIYKGQFTPEITANILSLTENNLIKANNPNQFRRKVYFIIVECLQNITRHQTKWNNTSFEQSGIFILQKKSDSYVITTGNVIDQSNVESLKYKIDLVNNLNIEELRDYYSNVLQTGSISERGGAGLGLIAIARKSLTKFNYGFKTIDENHSFFYLSIEVPMVHANPVNLMACSPSLLEDTMYLHNLLQNENLVLNFDGSFDQMNFISFLAILVSQMRNQPGIKKKLFTSIIELLQNIVYYGVNSEIKQNNNNKGNPGIFLFFEKNNQIYLTSGNYVATEKTPTLVSKLDFINTMDIKILDAYYMKLLFNFSIEQVDKPDLSFAEMRLTTKNCLFYDLQSVNQDCAFFTIQLIVDGFDI